MGTSSLTRPTLSSHNPFPIAGDGSAPKSCHHLFPPTPHSQSTRQILFALFSDRPRIYHPWGPSFLLGIITIAFKTRYPASAFPLLTGVSVSPARWSGWVCSDHTAIVFKTSNSFPISKLRSFLWPTKIYVVSVPRDITCLVLFLLPHLFTLLQPHCPPYASLHMRRSFGFRSFALCWNAFWNFLPLGK